MVKNVYFHVEKRDGNGTVLIATGYRDSDLQVQKSNLVNFKEYREFNSQDKVSRELLNMTHKNTYGSPLAKNSNLSISEIASVTDTVFGEVDMTAVSRTKDFTLRGIISTVEVYLQREGLSLRNTESYRVIVEIEG